MRRQLRQQGWRDVHDAAGELAGWLFRERRRTGQPLLYYGRTARGTVVPVWLADMEPVLAAILAAHSPVATTPQRRTGRAVPGAA